jgi:hypothetical protein
MFLVKRDPRKPSTIFRETTLTQKRIRKTPNRSKHFSGKETKYVKNTGESKPGEFAKDIL